MSDAQTAIRETDEVTHSHALAGAIMGIVGGLVVGAAIGAFIVGTGGLGALALVAGGAALTTSTAMVGATLLGATLVGGSIGGMFGKMFGSHSTQHKGMVLTGSPNVFIGYDRKRAARARADVAHCDSHSDAEPAHDQPAVLGKRIAQGSGTVLINGFYAAREGGHGTCDFVLGKGWQNVFIGGPTVTTEKIDGEVPPFVDHLIAGMGYVGTGLLMLPGAVAMFSAGSVAGLTGSALRVGANLVQVGARLYAQYQVGKHLSEAGGVIAHDTARYFGAKDGSLASDTATLVGQTAAPFAGAKVYKGIADAPLPNMRAAPPAAPAGPVGGTGAGEPLPTAANDNAAGGGKPPVAANDNTPPPAANDNVAPNGETAQQIGKNAGGTNAGGAPGGGRSSAAANDNAPGGSSGSASDSAAGGDGTPPAANDNTPSPAANDNGPSVSRPSAAANDNVAGNDGTPAAANDNTPSPAANDNASSASRPQPAASETTPGAGELTSAANDNAPGGTEDAATSGETTSGETTSGETTSGETTEQPGSSKGGAEGEAPPDQAEAGTEAGTGDKAAAEGESDPTVQTGDSPGGETEPETASAPGKQAAAAKGVEIIDAKKSSLGEFDEISDGQFIEDKSAKGLGTLNPRTGLPGQTPEQWAAKQVYDKSVVRIDNLAKATATRPTVGGTADVPSLQEIQGIKNLKFRIDSTSPDVQAATEAQLQRLQAKYPDWTFSADYGP